MKLSEAVPKDTYHLAYVIMFLQGLAALLPWNLFITAEAFFHQRFLPSPYATSFLNWFSIAFNLTTLCTTLLLNFKSRSSSSTINLKSSIRIPLCILTSLLTIATIFVLIPSFTSTAYFYTTLLIVILSSVASSFLQAGVFQVLTKFPAKYTQAFMAGQALAGVLIALANYVITAFGNRTNSHDNIITIWTPVFALQDSTTINICAAVYFITGVLILFGCVAGAYTFEKLEITTYYCNSERVEEPLLLVPSHHNFYSILYKVRYEAYVVFITFAVTLAVFPKLVVSISPISSSSSSSLFIPMIYVLFNVGDLVGRVSASFVKSIGSAKNLATVASLRIVFPILFYYCNIISEKHSHNVVVFRNDLFPILFIFLCAFSNGFCSTVAMMFGPASVKTSCQKQASTILFLMLTLGLSFGSAMSFVISALLL